MRDSVFILSCIQYCSYMKLMAFCYLTNIYWSNSKMTPISYDYIMEYMTKREHYLALNCRFQIRLDGLMDKALDLRIRGRDFRVPLWANIFHFVILGFRSLQPEFAHANEINHDILRASTLFQK